MDRSRLSAMTIAELRALATTQGVPRAAKLRKEELVAALLPLLTATTPAPVLPSAQAPAGSSNLDAPPPAPLPPSTDGLPIPDRYGRDRLVLMVQDPHHIFAYWEVTPGNLDRARCQAGEGWTPVLVVWTVNGSEQREVDLRGGNYYLAVAPGTGYRAVLALRDRHGNLHALAESNHVATPVAGPSTSSDEQWMIVDETFQELLALAGTGGTGGESSSARFANSGVRLRQRTLDARVLTWDMSESTVGGLSSLALAKPGSVPSSLVLAAPAGVAAGGLSSHVLPAALAAATVPLSLSSLQSSLVMAQSLSSHSLSSVAMSSSSGALVRVSERNAVPEPARDAHHQANAGLAERGTLPPTAPAPTASAPAAAAPVASPAPAAPAPAATGPVPLHRLRGVDTIKPKSARRR